MKPDLKNLMKLSGIIAAGEFNFDGSLVSYEGEMEPEIAKSIAEMCAANMMMAKMQAHTFDRFSGMAGFEDAVGFSVSGPKLTVFVVGTIGVFIDNEKGNFDEIYRALADMPKGKNVC